MVWPSMVDIGRGWVGGRNSISRDRSGGLLGIRDDQARNAVDMLKQAQSFEQLDDPRDGNYACSNSCSEQGTKNDRVKLAMEG